MSAGSFSIGWLKLMVFAIWKDLTTGPQVATESDNYAQVWSCGQLGLLDKNGFWNANESRCLRWFQYQRVDLWKNFKRKKNGLSLNWEII